jgi:putative ABC transport system substrate-binding protein
MRCFLVGFFAAFVACQNSEKTVALVLPVEAPAILDIQDGFVTALKKSHPDYKVAIKKGLGDPNVMQSILKSLHTQNVPYVATIGVNLTKAAQNLCKEQTVIGLAAYKEFANDTTYIVEDEVGAKNLYDSFTTIFPDVQMVTLIHAQDDKIMKEVKALQSLMKQGGKNLQCLPIINTNDLQMVCAHIKGQVVLILKDLTVVSGLDVILKATKALGIPVVASDEGSVKAGATYAFGVSEQDIGKEGARLIADAIDGKKEAHVTKLAPVYLVGKYTPAELVKTIQQKANGYSIKPVA